MGGQALPLIVCNWGLYCPPPPVWGNLACGARVSSTPFESAGFPQSTVADFRMTLPEAEVNQPSQPPLSIFSLGEGTATSVIVNQLYTNACSHTGIGRSLRI